MKESDFQAQVVDLAKMLGWSVWLGHGFAYDWLLDPYNNTLAAWELSREGTVTSPWPNCGW